MPRTRKSSTIILCLIGQGSEPKLELPAVNSYLRRLQHEYLGWNLFGRAAGAGPGFYVQVRQGLCRKEHCSRHPQVLLSMLHNMQRLHLFERTSLSVDFSWTSAL